MFSLILWEHFSNFAANATFSFQDMYSATVRGYINELLHSRTHWEDLPQEFRDKARGLHEHMNRHEFEELFYVHNMKPTYTETSELKKQEIQRKFEEKYKMVEWAPDGRIVTDEDYDEIEPKFERKLHRGRVNRDRLEDAEISMLLEEDF